MENNIIKQLREEANLTQEAVADLMDVSVNTIQNWERTGKIAKESLHELLDVYKTDSLTRNRVVLSLFGDSRAREQKGSNDNFPGFLFEERPDIEDAARRAVLSADEMDVFGISYYINGNSDRYYDYMFFKENQGYFSAMNKIAAIKGKIGDYQNSNNNYFGNKASLANVAYNYGLSNPGEGFSFVMMSKSWIIANVKNLPNLDGEGVDLTDLYKLCKAVEEPFFLGTSGELIDEYELPAELRKIIKKSSLWYSENELYEMKLDEISNQCFEIDKRELDEEEYLQKKEQYLSDRKAYDEHPGLYDKEPSFKYEFEYWLQLTEIGKMYIEWVEN